MKLLLKSCMLAIVLMLASCNAPIQYPTLNPEKVVLKVGEQASIELVDNDYRVHHVERGKVYSRHEGSEQVCEISDVKESSFIIKALRPGVDTVVVEYGYTISTFAYGSHCILPIRIEEW